MPPKKKTDTEPQVIKASEVAPLSEVLNDDAPASTVEPESRPAQHELTDAQRAKALTMGQTKEQNDG